MTSEVYCQMVYARIPASVCEKEQGTESCQGCSAPSRRCVRCGGTNGIADSKKGLCDNCATPQVTPRMRNDGLAGVLERMTASLAQMGNVKPKEQNSPPSPAPLSPPQRENEELTSNVQTVKDTNRIPQDQPVTGTPAQVVINTVAKHFGISTDVLLNEDRDVASVARARQITMYLLRRVSGYSYSEIGRICGRDHSTVMHGCDLIMQRRGADQGLNAQIKALETQLAAIINPSTVIEEHKTAQTTSRSEVPIHCWPQRPRINHDQILKRCEYVCVVVADFFKLNPNLLRLRLHQRDALTGWARTLAIYLMEDYYKIPQKIIGRFFSGLTKDHINHCSRRVQEQLSSNPQIQSQLAALKQKLDEGKIEIADETPIAPNTAPAPISGFTAPMTIQQPSIGLPRPLARPRFLSPAITKTYSDIYQFLILRSSKTGEERIVRGAVPLLQMEIKVGPNEAIRILQRLLDDGHIARRDDRWTIILLKDKIDNDEFVYQSPVLTQLAILQGGRQIAPPKPQTILPIRQLPIPCLAPKEDAPILDAIDAAIAQLTNLLPSLRQARDEVNQQVAALEANLMALTALRGQYQNAEASAKQLLQDTGTAVAQLLATLRKT